MTNCEPTCATSSTPITSPGGSKPQGPHPIRIHLQSLDFRAKQIHNQPAPANAGTEQLTLCEGDGSCLQDPRTLDVVGNASDLTIGKADANRGKRNCALWVVAQNDNDCFSV